MAELKTKATTDSVADFVASLDDGQQADVETLLTLYQKATKQEPVLWGSSIIGFGNIHYKYASGREGDWFAVGFSPRKANLTLYVLASFEGKDSLAVLLT